MSDQNQNQMTMDEATDVVIEIVLQMKKNIQIQSKTINVLSERLKAIEELNQKLEADLE